MNDINQAGENSVCIDGAMAESVTHCWWVYVDENDRVRMATEASALKLLLEQGRDFAETKSTSGHHMAYAAIEITWEGAPLEDGEDFHIEVLSPVSWVKHRGELVRIVHELSPEAIRIGSLGNHAWWMAEYLGGINDPRTIVIPQGQNIWALLDMRPSREVAP